MFCATMLSAGLKSSSMRKQFLISGKWTNRQLRNQVATTARFNTVLNLRGGAAGNGGNAGGSGYTLYPGPVTAVGITAATLATSLFLSADTTTSCESSPSDKFANTAFYPPISPFKKGLLKVSDVHSIAYSVYGNPDGKPVLIVHGGPGGGTTPEMARYFDPTKYMVVLVDQRGCGDSVPFADLTDNTTYDSVRDFEKIRTMLGIDRWMVFGGSWGSTLSLVYAMEHPQRVTELVLRGIFLVTERELEWMYQGPGGSSIFPEDWAAYEAAIPVEERGDYMKAYGKRLRGELGNEEMHKAAKAWSIWEGRISKLTQDPPEKVNLKHGDDHFSLAFARIENHYFTNKAWFPRDRFLLEEENIAKIRHIPTVIVQGRYDIVCPPVMAYQLHQALMNGERQGAECELVYTMTGHSGMETGIIEELVKAAEKFKNK